MAATCDHLLWGAANLDVGIAALEERTDVRATAGGQHPDLGTHNAIAALGRKRFLEVIAPDPTLPPGALARRLAAMKSPALIMWAARTSSAVDTAARAEAEGYQVAVVEGHRSRPDGKLARWTNVFVTGHGGGTLVPSSSNGRAARTRRTRVPGACSSRCSVPRRRKPRGCARC